MQKCSIQVNTFSFMLTFAFPQCSDHYCMSHGLPYVNYIMMANHSCNSSLQLEYQTYDIKNNCSCYHAQLQKNKPINIVLINNHTRKIIHTHTYQFDEYFTVIHSCYL